MVHLFRNSFEKNWKLNKNYRRKNFWTTLATEVLFIGFDLKHFPICLAFIEGTHVTVSSRKAQLNYVLYVKIVGNGRTKVTGSSLVLYPKHQYRIPCTVWVCSYVLSVSSTRRSLKAYEEAQNSKENADYCKENIIFW